MQNKFTFLMLLTLFLISNSLKSQNTCFYVEDKPISRGYKCIQDTLHFTNSVETHIKGEISANEVIIIEPSPLHDIIIKANDTDCQNCAEGEGTTTIRTKDRTGGGKDSKMQNIDTPPQYKISLKKNPAKNLLEIYNPKNIAITQYNIYDSFGNKIQSSSYSTSSNEILISHLPNGIYRVVLNTNENITYTLTFIKN